MKKQVVLGAVLGTLVAVAAADDGLTPQQIEALTTIDSVPTRTELEHALGSQTPALLLAQAADGSGDTGVRLRAINALPEYYAGSGSGDPVDISLHTVIGDNSAQLAGSDLVVLRAAIEALGQLKVPTDDQILYPLLNHPSRDIRAATARAFGTLCNTAANNALRIRYQNESTDEVKLAISETLRILSQPCPVN